MRKTFFGVKVLYNTQIFEVQYIEPMYEEIKLLDNENYTLSIDEVKPYLFPLSSITIEQEKELLKLGVSYGEYALHDDVRGLGIMVDETYIFFEFCYKHHIDVLGLIEMGLAIDATGLGIYENR